MTDDIPKLPADLKVFVDPEKDEIKKAHEELKRGNKSLETMANDIAKSRYLMFEAYVEVGFTREEALSLVIEFGG